MYYTFCPVNLVIKWYTGLSDFPFTRLRGSELWQTTRSLSSCLLTYITHQLVSVYKSFCDQATITFGLLAVVNLKIKDNGHSLACQYL